VSLFSYSSSYHINAVPILDRFAEASGEWQPVADWIHAQQTLQSMSLATTLDMPLHRMYSHSMYIYYFWYDVFIAFSVVQ
jgi:ABC-type protease/lipase transport system fused ATPase/permease subunit